jgi:hypothetical protein
MRYEDRTGSKGVRGNPGVEIPHRLAVELEASPELTVLLYCWAASESQGRERSKDQRGVYETGWGSTLPAVPMASPERTSSTLRFCWRPSAVSLPAMGSVLPKP